jgi:hypothetical protein
VTGFDYDSEMECPKEIKVKQGCDKPVIAMVHSSISDESLSIGNKFKLRDYREIVSNASVILSGHYHCNFGPVKENLMCPTWCNPGSFARTSITDFREGSGPGLAYIKVYDDYNIKIKRYSIKCDKNPFRLIEKLRDKELETIEFENAVKDLENSDVIKSNLSLYLDSLYNNRPKSIKKFFNKKVMKICKTKLEDAKNEQ